MSILSGILGNYGDDMFRAASNVAANKADDALLKAAKNKVDNIALKGAKKATKSTATQRKARNEFEDFVTSFGTVGKDTRKQLLEDYGGGLKNWSKLRELNIDSANLQDASKKALGALGGIQKGLYDYADNAGIGVTVGDLMQSGKGKLFTTAQKNRLAEVGLDLDDLAKGGVITTNEADNLYKTVRDLGVKYRKSTDATQTILGKQLGSLAESLKKRIDDTVSPISKSFGLKKQLSDALYGIGDGKRARQISQMADDEVAASLLRKEMQPYMVAQDLIGLKLPTQKNINIMGIDTGIKNPLPELGKKVGSIPLNVQAAMENGLGDNAKAVVAGGAGLLGGLLGASALGGDNNAAPASTSTLGSLMGGDAYGGMSGMGGLGGDTMAQSTYMSQAEPTIGGYSYDDLENAYVSAIMAGDSGAASVIADMIGMLDNKTKRSESSKSKSSGDEKAKAGLNTLQELYRLYQSFGGAQGMVKGNITGALNTVSGGAYNPAAATFDAVAQGSIGRIVKAMGDSGALSDSDKQNALKMIPKVSDSPALAEQKFQSLYELLLEAAQGE
jgi:hypothetical protein